MQFGIMLCGQYAPEDDAVARFAEICDQARLADALGFASITKGSHCRPTGVNHLIASMHWPGMENAVAKDAMQLFAEEVIPRVEQGL